MEVGSSQVENRYEFDWQNETERDADGVVRTTNLPSTTFWRGHMGEAMNSVTYDSSASGVTSIETKDLSSNMKITLLGEPKSTQSIYKYACRGRHPAMYMTADGKALKDSYALQGASQWAKRPIMEGDIKIDVTVYHGSHRRSDWDNFHKLSMDSLTGIVWEDDSQIIDASVHKRYDPTNPRIEIEIL
jgi:Holliday junction resolvase RusA-like endonuclease